jgi:soluble lytic murein transglycosylase-like protein
VTHANYRIICDCQRHSQPNAITRVRRTLSRSAAVIVGIPLAFFAVDPTSLAMDLTLPEIDVAAFRQMQTERPAAEPSRAAVTNGLPIFTTDMMRSQFYEPPPREPLTLDVFKERYFRRHVPYGAIIYREAIKNDLPPELVAAMVHTESDFRPSLVSHKSAQGLMQIVPDTARLLGITDPFDPEENIAAGTRYFRYLLDRFDDRTMALAAYNAGEGNVVRFGGIPPFSETRNYIARVDHRTQRYRQRVHNEFLANTRIRRPVH